ncbi:hypothetical protein [Aquibacillus kalidii]|uniref:hypothetical protein n=1 Tax=Aquibacillus kalidii TaxID=2762597 RepID=UPI001646AD90|nr:hypothetical protein [Aquibacillus kalidii]
MQISTVLIPVLGVLGGAYIGGYLSNKSQQESIKQNAEIENLRQRKHEIIQTLEVYNSVLKIDGESLLVTPAGGTFVDFETELYQEGIRPLLYEKFHLIHSDVADIVRKMDQRIADCMFNEETEDTDHDYLIKQYVDLIHRIQNHLKDYRDRF